METRNLKDTHSRTKVFQQGVLLNLDYWHTWVARKTADVAALDRERERIVRAISFALDVGEIAWPSAYLLILTFSPFMERRGYWDSWNNIVHRAIAAAQSGGDVANETTLSALLARLFVRQSRFKEAVTAFRRTIQTARQVGDHFTEARACSNLGYLYVEQGQWWRAEVLCCHALHLFEQIPSDHGQAHTENHLGVLFTQTGLFDKAQQHLERACAIWKRMGDDHGLMNGYNNLGRLLNEKKLPDQALPYLEKALERARLTGEETLVGTIYMNIGIAYRLKGHPLKAIEYHRRAETLFLKYSNVYGLALVRDNLGLAHSDQKHWQAAGFYLQAALETWHTLGNTFGEMRAMTYWVEYELAQGNQHEAQAWLEKAAQFLRQSDPYKRYQQLQMRVEDLRRSFIE